jgi:type I site-specific restriction-modification system R (restriction) subunit
MVMKDESCGMGAVDPGLHDALPNASFIGFTGAPIEKVDANTRQVFGEYISIYDIQRAVSDGATVPIYYEGRLAKLELKESERPRIDPQFEEVTEREEVDRKEKLKSQWSRLEALVGAENRLKLIARDIVKHYEERNEVMEGKAMIVCMSRRICVGLFNEITALRPQWKQESDEQGGIKVVMTGSASDPLDWQRHIRNKTRREALAKRFRDPKGPFNIVIVRDMWLTRFDAPSLHTMYVDKPMRGHGLMQAIARVNRVFRDKSGGLIVDYIGLAEELKQAMSTYTESGGTGKTAIDQAEAVAVMLEKFGVCLGLFQAVSSDTVMDVFAMAGLKKPDISILSEQFLAEVRGMPQKLLSGEIRTRFKRNVVVARSFAEMLESALRKYKNRAIETAQVIEELIALAREMNAAGNRGVDLGLNEDKLAFYDALETNDSAVKVLGEPTLKKIARELVVNVRKNVSIDWTVRENVRAQLRVQVKRILRKYGYPPDKQEKATETVLEQAAVLSEEWAVA